jgi:predicted CoA-binding protein
MSTRLTEGLTTDMAYAIYGSASEFGPDAGPRQLTPTAIKPKYEARAIYELLKGVGTRVYPVSKDVKLVDGDTAYNSIDTLPERVDVLITSLKKELAPSVIEEAARAGIKRIWFQPATFDDETLRLCAAKNIEAIKGCAVRHRTVSGLTRFISPCFYMGLRATKLPVK